MSNLKAMKFKINSPEHSKQIQEKLFELGYYWGISGKSVLHTGRPALYANYFGDETLTYSTCLGDFEDRGDYNCVEYFLVNGKFITADEYFVYPETTYEPLPDEGHPVPTITPRVEFLRQRVSEILAAMTRFNELKMVPPNDWHEELEEIFMEIRNHA